MAEELGLDVVGAAPASAYDETEEHIRERKARGLFADMRFTMAQPEVSCHPESLLPGARTVVSAAHCYYTPEPPLDEAESLRLLSKGAQNGQLDPDLVRVFLEMRAQGLPEPFSVSE